MAQTKDYAAVVAAKLAANPDLAAAVEHESFNSDIAMKVYNARCSIGITQAQLAERAGTHQSVISRIEDADYDGHSLTLLRRVAEALGGCLRVEFSPTLTSSVPDLEAKKHPPKRKPTAKRKPKG